ncbi:MAG TPA: tRNA pseudouridine(55) synthase TruB [Casimicrobiaceae bacterium]|nr:tRNA pseudouridine(55) synthase TruB [Casimicrobiaceae bacterium]
MSSRTPRIAIDGVLLLDKPVGLTSNAALQRVKRLFGAARAGHAGTLDPLASGLLPIAFGEATKLLRFTLDADKRYTACVHFGVATATGDAEGQVIDRQPADFTHAQLDDALGRFVGVQWQTPPRHAALKLRGRAYYDYARAGEEIERTPREVRIDSLALVEWAAPLATLDVACGKGTYVRVLAEDLGRSLNSVAHLAMLRRTAAGGFSVDDAISLETLEGSSIEQRMEGLLPPLALVEKQPRIVLGDEEIDRFARGVKLSHTGSAPGIHVCLSPAGALIGLGDFDGAALRPIRVTHEAAFNAGLRK